MHAAFFILAVVSFPWLKKEFVIPQPVSIELVDISKVTETNQVAPQPEKKDDKKKDAPPPPPKAAQNTADSAVVPVKKDMKEDNKPVKKEEVLVDKNAIPDKKKVKKDTKKEVTEQQQKDFSSVLKNLVAEDEKPKSAPPVPDMKVDEKADSGQQAPLGQKMTMSEEDALRRQLERCWNVPFGAKDAQDMVVEIFMVINPDRTLREARVVNISRYNSDSFFRAAADSALRAVRNPLCSPFELPADKYDLWKTTTVTFNPSQMF